MIAKQHHELLHFEFLDVIHVKFQNQSNKNFKIPKTLLPPAIFAHMILSDFIFPRILCLHSSLLTILIPPKAVRLYITKNIHQIIFLLDNMKPFGVVNMSVCLLQQTSHPTTPHTIPSQSFLKNK